MTSEKERRGFNRIPVGEDVKICEGDLFFSGTVLNLSERGMFIGTRKYFQLDTIYLIVMRLKNRLLKLPAVIKRSTGSTGYYDGIGVELVNPPLEYVQFVETWRND
jgi:hypothetical protein